MTRRYALAWSAGASLGYVVGWLAGSAVRDQRDFRALTRPARRPEPRTPSRTGVESREAGNGAQTGAQRVGLAALADDPAWWAASAELPAPRLYTLDEVAAEYGIDLDEPDDATPCPASSPTRHLPCIRVGPHDDHWWQDPRTEEKR